MTARISRWWVGLLALTGFLILASAGWHLINPGPHAASVLHLAIDIVLVGGAGVGILYGSYWHALRAFPPEQYPRIVAWIIGSTLLFASLTVIGLYLGSEQVTPAELLATIHPIGSVGVLAGLLVGTIHAKAIVHAEAAARAEAHTEALEAEQHRMTRLTDLLRHYILNDVNIILGYTDQLRDVVPADKKGKLETITRRAADMATLINHLRIIQDDDPPPATPRDFESVLTSATVDVRDLVDVTIEPPDDGTDVLANDVVEDALALLCEGLATAIDTGGTLVLACDHSEHSVTLTVTAAPAVLSQAVRESLFEPIESGIGLKLYLAKQLLEAYGDLRLIEHSDDALVFSVTLEAPTTP